jgi:hypothetical protein
MVEALQGKAVKVGKVSGDMKRGDHAHARLHVDCACQPAVDQENTVLELLTIFDKGFVGGDPSRFGDQASDRALLGSGDRVTLSQLAEMSFDHFVHT